MKSNSVSRRDFLRSGTKSAGIAAAGAMMTMTNSGRVLGANDRVNMAIIGIRSRGMEHAREWTRIPNVQVASICDIDQRLFPERVVSIDEWQGKKPRTESDLRRVLDDKNIDAVSIATCDHWHALAAIWACQAGKHVYVEKPISHNIWEGRRIIDAARKYKRVVAPGTQNRSIAGVCAAMKFLHDGGIGDVYMARALCFKPRDTIGFMQNEAVPVGVDYDLWLGPAPWRPFNPNRFHYNWHWYWDYGMPDIGNQGPHQMDIARWGLQKDDYPKKIKSIGGYYAFSSQQETPNTQIALFEYDDGKILQFETRGIYTNTEEGVLIGNLFYGSEGWMWLNGDSWATFFGRKNDPGPSSETTGDIADPGNLAGAGGSAHFANFIDAVRADDFTKLNADIIEGHRSTAMIHLADISYRTGRELEFDTYTETFPGDDQANGYLRRNYRHPYVVPEDV